MAFSIFNIYGNNGSMKQLLSQILNILLFYVFLTFNPRACGAVG